VKTLSYFDKNGRRIPSNGMRVFGETQSQYYKLERPQLNLASIFDRSRDNNLFVNEIDVFEFDKKISNIILKISNDVNYSNLLNGVYVPFIYKREVKGADLGTELVDILLTKLHKSFINKFPESHFKAILQSQKKLENNIKLDKNSRYQNFVSLSEVKPVIGLYFPQALQEFDVETQRNQMTSLPELTDLNICLSGGMDVCAALIGTPDLLISENFYAPIPILSAYVHEDQRLVLMIKAYGPHLEFWCLSQMLDMDTTQVSEQWTGGLTIYE
jgi:hypothetical protein